VYVSKHHALPEPGEAQALVEAHPLGAWVVPGSEGLVANERLVGKLKASQDEALQDRWGTASRLAAEGSENAAAMAVLVERAAQRLR